MQIICDDSSKAVLELDNNSIDLVVTSPPYNVNLGHAKISNRGEYDSYDDNRAHDEYIKWLSSFFRNLYPKMKDNARVCINIGDGKNGAVPTHSDVTQFMTRSLGYNMYTTIIWNKNTCSNRLSWGSFQSPSAPSFPTPYEHILVFSKGNQPKELDFEPLLNQEYEFWSEITDNPLTWKDVLSMRAIGDNKQSIKKAKNLYRNVKKKYKSDMTSLTKEEFIDYSWPIWNIAPQTNQKKHGHPAMFPLDLPYRLIKMLSYKNDMVLDPFMGVGTTGMACKQLERRFIGIDISENYCEIAKNRIKNH